MTTTTIEPTQQFFCTAALAGQKHELEYDEDTILGGDGKRVRVSGRFRPRNLPIPKGIGPRATPSQVRFELVSQTIGKRARYVDEVGTDTLKARILRDRRMWFVEDIAEKQIIVAPAVVHRHMSVDKTPTAETPVTVKEEPESDAEVHTLSSTSTPTSTKKSKTSFGSLRSFSTAVAKAKSSLSKLKARMERKAITRSTASSSRSRSPEPVFDSPELAEELDYGTETEVDEEEQLQEEKKVQEKKLRRSMRLREKRKKEKEEAAAEEEEAEGQEAENERDAEAAGDKKPLDDDSTPVEAPEQSGDDTTTIPTTNSTNESEDSEEVREEASKDENKEEDTDSTPELKSSFADSDLDLPDLTPTSTVSSTSSTKSKKKKRRSRAEKEARLRKKKKKSSQKALGFEDIEMVDDMPTGGEAVEETSMEPTNEATEAKPDVDDASGVKDVELPASSVDSEDLTPTTTSKPAFPIPTDILTPPPTPPRRAPATPTTTIDIAAVIEKLTPPTTPRKPSTRSRLSAILQNSILRFDPGNISRHAYRDPFPPIREDEEEEEGAEAEVVLVQVGCGGKGEGMGVEGVLEGLERFSMAW